MDVNGKLTDATVLVVDATAASRYAIGTVLRRAGHEVVAVTGGRQALSELDVRRRKGNLPDVALIDVHLPDMSGFELCRRLKERPHMAGLPIVHFSALSVVPADRCPGLDSGAEAYLTVPAEPEEIEATVRAVVRAARLRADDQALVRRLRLLSETIVTIQAARSLHELADAAADGAARLLGCPAAVFVLDQDDELYRGLYGERTSLALPDEDAHRTVRDLMRRLTRGQSDVQITTVPSPQWPAGFFRPGVQHDARLALVLTQDGKAPVCLATPTRGLRRVSPEGEALLAQLAHATALAAEPLLMYQVERHVALTLQHSFLPRPHQLPELPGVDIAVRYEPASQETEIGGDFYAALRVRDGVLTAVGDVVGHSLDAATVMVELRHALRAYCLTESDPAALAERLDLVLQHYHAEVTATVCLALIDPATGRTRIANAGHIPPLILGDDGSAEYVKASGPLLGVGLSHPRPPSWSWHPPTGSSWSPTA